MPLYLLITYFWVESNLTTAEVEETERGCKSKVRAKNVLALILDMITIYFDVSYLVVTK